MRISIWCNSRGMRGGVIPQYLWLHVTTTSRVSTLSVRSWGMGSCWDVAEGSMVTIPTAMVMAKGEFGYFLFRWWQMCFSVLFFCGALWPSNSPQTHQRLVSGYWKWAQSIPYLYYQKYIHIYNIHMIHMFVCEHVSFESSILHTHPAFETSSLSKKAGIPGFPTAINSPNSSSSIGGCPKDNVVWPSESVGTRRTDFVKKSGCKNDVRWRKFRFTVSWSWMWKCVVCLPKQSGLCFS